MRLTRRDFAGRTAAVAAWAAVPGRVRLPAQAPSASPPAKAFELIRRNTGFFTGRGGTIGWDGTPASVLGVACDELTPGSHARR